MFRLATLLLRVAAAMVLVGPGVLEERDPAAKATREVKVPAFLLDRVPVTNREFLGFVEAAPEWQRGRVPHPFADERYLSHWESPTSTGRDIDPDAPVVFVSWFAARAYCRSRGARLPTVAEWDLAARASERRAQGEREPGWRQRILDWYATPSPARLPPVGSGRPNFWKVYDLYGLVWEWTFDFNSELVSADARGENATRYCGGGALEGDVSDYAAFMRKAFRSSLKAPYTEANLGFRCAADAGKRGLR